jgi:hypothetical protein
MVKVVVGPNHNSKGESLRYGCVGMAVNPLTKCDRQHRMAFSAGVTVSGNDIAAVNSTQSTRWAVLVADIGFKCGIPSNWR